LQNLSPIKDDVKKFEDMELKSDEDLENKLQKLFAEDNEINEENENVVIEMEMKKSFVNSSSSKGTPLILSGINLEFTQDDKN